MLVVIAIKVLGRLLASSRITRLPMAFKIPAGFPPYVSRRNLSQAARNRRLEEEMSVVHEVGKIVTSTLDIQQVYDEFASQLKKLVDFDRISLAVVDMSAGTYQIKYSVEEGLRTDHHGRVLVLSGSRTQLAVESGQSFIQRDMSAGPVFVNDHLRSRAETASCIFVPLTGKDGVLGTLNLFSGNRGAFGPREQAILEGLANQIAPALANAQLYEESIKTQKAFQESDARFRRLMMQAADPLVLSDPDGRIVDVNDLACQALGYTREELLAMRVADFSMRAPPDVMEQNWQRLLSDEIINLETTHRRKDGATFPVEIRASLVELNGRQYRWALIRDVTERKRTEEEQDRWAQEN